jgi:hypothetical protein
MDQSWALFFQIWGHRDAEQARRSPPTEWGGRLPRRQPRPTISTSKRCVGLGKNAKKVRKVGKLDLKSYVKSREVNPKALSFF